MVRTSWLNGVVASQAYLFHGLLRLAVKANQEEAHSIGAHTVVVQQPIQQDPHILGRGTHEDLERAHALAVLSLDTTLHTPWVKCISQYLLRDARVAGPRHPSSLL